MPQAVVGVVIALLVLLPESIAAVNAARRDRTQISLNLALGSAMASIGLTDPHDRRCLDLARRPARPGPGCPPTIVLLSLTRGIVSVLTVVAGTATPSPGSRRPPSKSLGDD